jgi:hypothetical protein
MNVVKNCKKHFQTKEEWDMFYAQWHTVLNSKTTERYKENLPGWVVRWVRAFMTGRKTTLVIQGAETEAFLVPTGVPQGSPLSPILFLFYNSELLDLCQRPKEGLTAVGFADDVNMLAFSRSTETNCRILETGHSRCLDWAKRHGMKFAPTKYELIHFTRSGNST